MSSVSILAALERWEAAGRDVSDAVDHLSLDGRRALIRLRTEANQHFAALGAAIDHAIEAGSTEKLIEARQRCSALRRAISMHQARWPTVVISDNFKTYASESRILRTQRDGFAVWLRIAFAPKSQTTAQTVFHSR